MSTQQNNQAQGNRAGSERTPIMKVIEVLAESTKSWEDAAQVAVDNASQTLKNIRSVYIKEQTAHVENGKIQYYRINAKITFELER